jgi:hypothetical protein
MADTQCAAAAVVVMQSLVELAAQSTESGAASITPAKCSQNSPSAACHTARSGHAVSWQLLHLHLPAVGIHSHAA